MRNTIFSYKSYLRNSFLALFMWSGVKVKVKCHIYVYYVLEYAFFYGDAYNLRCCTNCWSGVHFNRVAQLEILGNSYSSSKSNMAALVKGESILFQ